MSSGKPTIAFFGATGGSGSTALTHALKGQHHCTALVRSPLKLRQILLTEHSVCAETIDEYLIIHQGDARNYEDVSKALISPASPTHLVSTIWTSLGVNPVIQLSLRTPLPLPAHSASITEDAMRAVFAAIGFLAAQHNIISTTSNTRPLAVIVSATASKDVWGSVPWPWIFAPLYKWLLGAPHDEKMRMEEVVYRDAGQHLRGFIILRPAILTDGPERGTDSVRVGWLWGRKSETGIEAEEEAGPAIGWSVGRKDLGLWAYENALKGGGDEWVGKCVSLCY
ncbi:hypothetical protein IQ06DRAFT_333006 [Phaeosphaeriaceae sp. SRC1lsM3a]|nr:hypothetical protein IQ06DRAFT_333006 [Stagonospora sp. SRC1lsM3a]